MTAPRTYRVIELFSGVGSQRMAFNIVSQRTGIQFEFLAQCDIDKYAIKSYNAIHGDTPNLGDITKLEKLPECDILTWSFPCQSLSHAGCREGMEKGSSATEFNVAQTRERCFMVSHYRGAVPDFPKPIRLNHVLNDYLESDPGAKYYLSPKGIKNIILEIEGND